MSKTIFTTIKLILILVSIFFTSLASAEVPRETIDRMVEILVQTEHLNHLSNSGQLPNKGYLPRLITLQKEADALWEPYLPTSQPGKPRPR